MPDASMTPEAAPDDAADAAPEAPPAGPDSGAERPDSSRPAPPPGGPPGDPLEEPGGKRGTGPAGGRAAPPRPGSDGWQRTAIGHVRVACTNCHRRHLACGVERPCQRCVAQRLTCTDNVHRKRGRPRKPAASGDTDDAGSVRSSGAPAAVALPSVSAAYPAAAAAVVTAAPRSLAPAVVHVYAQPSTSYAAVPYRFAPASGPLLPPPAAPPASAAPQTFVYGVPPAVPLVVPRALLVLSELGVVTQALPGCARLFGPSYQRLLRTSIFSIVLDFYGEPQRVAAAIEQVRNEVAAAARAWPVGPGQPQPPLRSTSRSLGVYVTGESMRPVAVAATFTAVAMPPADGRAGATVIECDLVPFPPSHDGSAPAAYG